MTNLNLEDFEEGVIEEMIVKFQQKSEAFGELNRDENSNIEVINLRNVSHRILNLRIENGEVKYTIDIIDTPRGLQAADWYSKCYPKIRMIGNRDQSGKIIDAELITIDLVCDELINQ